jgi:hypothetical protein
VGEKVDTIEYYEKTISKLDTLIEEEIDRYYARQPKEKRKRSKGASMLRVSITLE